MKSRLSKSYHRSPSRRCRSSCRAGLALTTFLLFAGLGLVDGFAQPSSPASLPHTDQPFKEGLRAFEESRNYDAIGYFHGAASKSPKAEPPVYWLGRSYLEIGDPASAVTSLALAVQRAPHRAINHYWLGRAHIEQQTLPDAIQAFRKATELDPAMDEALAWLGRTEFHHAMNEGEVTKAREALEHLTKAAELKPLEPRYRLWLARGLIRLGNSAAAAEHLEVADRRSTTDWQIRYELAQLHAEMGSHARALRELDHAATYAPDGASQGTVQYARGMALVRIGHGAEAVQAFHTAARYRPQLADESRLELLYWSGRANFLAGDFDTGASMMTQYLQARPYFVPGYFWLGRCRYAQADFDAAEKAFDLATKGDPGRAEYLYWAGKALYWAGRHQHAIETLEQAHVLNPRHGDTLWWLTAALMTHGHGTLDRAALTALKLGLKSDPAGAEEWLQKILSFTPQSEPANYAMGVVLFLQDRFSRALQHLETAARHPLSRTYAHSYAGWCHLAMNDFQSASEAFRSALSRQPDEVFALEGMAWLALLENKPEEALKAFKAIEGRALSISRLETGMHWAAMKSASGASNGHVQSKWSGLGVLSINSEIGQHLMFVLKDSPAALAGIKQGDVVTSVDGIPVSGERDWDSVLGKAPVHGLMILKVLRQGTIEDIVVDVSSRAE